MDGLIVTDLSIVPNEKGSIYHVMENDSVGFKQFGEAYFSSIGNGKTKGWKKHLRMTLNLVVPEGEVKIVVYNEIKHDFYSLLLSGDNYKRLTVSPGLWMAFSGMRKGTNLLLNIADIKHDPDEAVNVALEKIPYEW
jgi:dTDP-4-dehydrorhamnose 3,5-epimerase